MFRLGCVIIIIIIIMEILLLEFKKYSNILIALLSTRNFRDDLWGTGLGNRGY